jgi:alkanesulfonate monooxygenase SsuD/methylene tetrahydromethanopterin reductase-like flavin-dependent oxidoreductase (luciferase family)/4'-phosphopantetheinyl transferase EntD
MTERIGLLAFWKNYDRKLYLKAAKLADELGYDSFWLPEAWGYEVFSLLTEIACQTKRIKLGTGIVNAYSRSPGLLAMHAATLDEISEGRFMLGIGASGARVIEGFHGRPFTKPLTQVRDVIRVVRTLLAGGKLSDSGSILTEYRPFTLAMKPQNAHIPIYVAALKQKSIESIGEMADGWIPTFWPFEQLKQGREWIENGAKKAGRDPSTIATAPFTTVIPLGESMGKQQAKDIIAFYIGGMGDYYKELLSGFGYADECKKVEELYQDKATRSQAAAAVTDEMIHALCVTGDPQNCVEELRRRREYGIDLPILNLPPNVPWEMMEMFIRLMAPKLPRFVHIFQIVMPSSSHALLTQIVPPDAVVVEWQGSASPPDPLYIEEQALIEGSAPSRQHEFRMGRWCAKQAMRAFGIQNYPLVRKAEGRSPQWPPSVVGTITHTKDFGAAAVARRTSWLGIGLDVEIIGRMKPSLWSHTFTEEEIAFLRKLPNVKQALFATIMFSAKEAFYKCQYEVTSAWVGFHDVTLHVHENRFTVQLLKSIEGFPENCPHFEGHFRYDDQRAYTGISWSAVV